MKQVVVVDSDADVMIYTALNTATASIHEFGVAVPCPIVVVYEDEE